MPSTITVCSTCRIGLEREDKALPPKGEAFFAVLQAVVAGRSKLSLRQVNCLMGCDHGCNVAITAPGKMTYVLGGFDGSLDDAEGIAAYAEAHSNSASGAVPFKEWPQQVKGHFIARVPPADEMVPNL